MLNPYPSPIFGFRAPFTEAQRWARRVWLAGLVFSLPGDFQRLVWRLRGQHIHSALGAGAVTGAGEEQIGALAEVLPRFPAGMVLWAGPTHGNADSRALQGALSEAGVELTRVQAGQALDLGDGARLEVLATSERGAVLLLTHGSIRLLLPSGIDFENMETLKDDPRLKDVTTLLLADSGYGPSNPPEWLAALNPQLVLLSVAADDYEGRPAPEVLEAMEGRNLLRTDRNGWIELATDGEQMWVEVAR